MNLHLLCIDTRGSVQPYIALAPGFRAAGHRVTLIAAASV
jgi:UDP:flavonoid glycosyltransferase YjiC (YdhE family)